MMGVRGFEMSLKDHQSFQLALDSKTNVDSLPLIGEHFAELEALCCRYGVRQLEVLGSVVSGAFDPATSDLDFLVEFEPPVGLGYADRYFGLQKALETLFGQPVDLVVTSGVKNPYFLQSIHANRNVVYDARG